MLNSGQQIYAQYNVETINVIIQSKAAMPQHVRSGSAGKAKMEYLVRKRYRSWTGAPLGFQLTTTTACAYRPDADASMTKGLEEICAHQGYSNPNTSSIQHERDMPGIWHAILNSRPSAAFQLGRHVRQSGTALRHRIA